MPSDASTPSDAISLLTQDHQAVDQLFSAFKALAERHTPAASEKSALAEQICMHLNVHAQVEQEIFYPAVRRAIDDDATIDQAEAAHAAAKDLIADISSMTPNDAQFDAAIAVLGARAHEHAKQEQRGMFAKARRAGLDLATLGTQIAARKRSLLDDYAGRTARGRWEDEDADPVGDVSEGDRR